MSGKADERTGLILFYPNLAVEEVSNYKLLLSHSHFDYVEPLLNRIRPPLKKDSSRHINQITFIYFAVLKISQSKFHIDLEYDFLNKKWFSTQVWGFIDRLC